jgi:hypothetical protein
MIDFSRSAEQPTPRYASHAEIAEKLASRSKIKRLESSILVPTDVLMPGGVNIVAVIEGGATGDRITATDAGVALSHVIESGFAITAGIQSAAAKAAKASGLSYEQGVLRTPPVGIQHSAWLVRLIANGTREVAVAALEAARRRERIRFRDRVQYELSKIFGEASVDVGVRLSGVSTDTHRFDYLLSWSGHRIAIDVPVPESGSVAAVVLRQTDLRESQPGGLRQAIAYDQDDRWPSSTLAQLKLAKVPLVRASHLESDIRTAAG